MSMRCCFPVSDVCAKAMPTWKDNKATRTNKNFFSYLNYDFYQQPVCNLTVCYERHIYKKESRGNEKTATALVSYYHLLYLHFFICLLRSYNAY